MTTHHPSPNENNLTQVNGELFTKQNSAPRPSSNKVTNIGEQAVHTEGTTIQSFLELINEQLVGATNWH
jgi:hypothetical protein